MKLCTKCGKKKELTEFRKHSQSKDGLRPHCKACVSAYNKAHYAKDSERHRARRMAHYEANREASLAAHREWAKANAERVSEYNREYRDSHPEYRKRNLERVIAWSRSNPDRFSANQAAARGRRRARIKGVPADRIDYSLIVARDGMVCHICGGQVERAELSFDHVIPIAKGGPHVIDNIKVAHGRCNSRKGARCEV